MALSPHRSTWSTPAQSPHALLLDALCEAFAHVPRAEWLARMQAGLVTNGAGAPLSPTQVFLPQQSIHYSRSVPNEALIPVQERIVFENDAMVVADKPHFLPVVPSGGYVRETLLWRLQQKLNCPDLVPAHRIDRDTAGLVLFIKQRQHRGAYQNLFRDRLVDKTYLALAPDAPDFPPELQLQSWLQSSPAHFMQMQCLPSNAEGSTNATTTIKKIAVQAGLTALNAKNALKNTALYQLQPQTGLRHQLRVQMASLGLPILNDGLYPVVTPACESPHLQPALQLLAWRLGFVDPLSGEALQWQSALQLDCDWSAVAALK